MYAQLTSRRWDEEARKVFVSQAVVSKFGTTSGTFFETRSGDDDRLTSSPKSVDSDPIEDHCDVCLSGRTWDVRREAMASNGEWKVLVDILYCVA